MTGHARTQVCSLALLLTSLIFAAPGCSEAPADPAMVTATAGAGKPLPPPKIELDGVACLSTAWYPQSAECNVENENPLTREIIRQGVLMALREELQLVTRDETLGEPFTYAIAENNPQGEQFDPLRLAFSWDRSSTWRAELSGAGAPANNPVWKHDGAFKFHSKTFYPQMAAQIADLAEPIAESLRNAGAAGEPRALNPENTPPDAVDAWLSEMNFVSQYAAVRAAHLAMAEKGPSLPWLGVLVRGYANLAMLTQHAWTSQQDAFAARALVYAERLMRLSDNSQSARWHQAYAYAVIGMHGHALDLVAAIEKQAKSSTEGKQANENDAPAWAALIEPLCKFQPTALEELAANVPDLAELAGLLRWNIYRSYMHGRWIHEQGVEAMQAAPEAYSIYSVLANWSALGVKRMGASAGMTVFGGRLPTRIAELDDLPKHARAFTGAPSSLLSNLLGTRPQTAMGDRPIKIAKALVAVTEKETTPTECSWAILATLIADEQFVQAANILKVSGDAVEHSQADLVERLAPLVEGHRYAPYIHSFAAPRNQPHLAAEKMRDMVVVDPRPPMRPMFSKVWHAQTASGNGNDLSYRTIWSRNFTLPALQGNWYDMASWWTEGIPAEHRRWFATEFRRVSPHSPQAVRMQWETAEKYDVADLAKWEKQLADDPVGWLALAERYHRHQDLRSATRCYERSVAISPSYNATVGLANSYWDAGKKDLWRSTLESYLELEDLGLTHAQIHQQIANEAILRRAWSEAEPHAMEAAQTYSAWGLALGSVVNEGKQDWEKSERFIREAAENYPTYSSGVDWYFWCRRTGRGDLDKARELAERSVALASTRTYFNDAYRVFVYRLLEGDGAGALAGMDQQIRLCGKNEDPWDRVWRVLHTIDVAGDADNDPWKQQALTELRALAQDEIKKSDPGWVLVLDTLADAFDGKRPDAEALKRYDEVTEGGYPNGRCNYQYFMAAALEHLGEQEAADDYYRRAAFGGPFDNFNATLAGHRLVERHGPDRGGLPERYAKQDAESEAAWAAQSEQAAEEPAPEEPADADQSI